MIDLVGELTIDPFDIPRLRKDEESGDKRISLSENILYTIRGVGNFVEAFKAFPGSLPNSVKILMKHILARMHSKAWMKEQQTDSHKSKFQHALMRLLLNQLLLPVIVSPELEGIYSGKLTEIHR